MMKILLENCAASVASCLYAEEGGAGRIELCAALPEGGTTPSHGLVKVALQSVKIPIFPIIRPRAGDFLYSADELDTMETDIRDFVSLGVQGIVTGVLRADGSLDRKACERLIGAAQGLPVTLHRAFDRVKHPEIELERAIDMGFARILTSGCRPTAPEGADLIHKLVKQANGRIVIMAGSGIRPDNVLDLVQRTGVQEVHGTLQTLTKTDMDYRNPDLEDSTAVHIDEVHHMTTDTALVRAVVNNLSSLT